MENLFSNFNILLTQPFQRNENLFEMFSWFFFNTQSSKLAVWWFRRLVVWYSLPYWGGMGEALFFFFLKSQINSLEKVQ